MDGLRGGRGERRGEEEGGEGLVNDGWMLYRAWGSLKFISKAKGGI